MKINKFFVSAPVIAVLLVILAATVGADQQQGTPRTLPMPPLLGQAAAIPSETDGTWKAIKVISQIMRGNSLLRAEKSNALKDDVLLFDLCGYGIPDTQKMLIVLTTPPDGKAILRSWTDDGKRTEGIVLYDADGAARWGAKFGFGLLAADDSEILISVNTDSITVPDAAKVAGCFVEIFDVTGSSIARRTFKLRTQGTSAP